MQAAPTSSWQPETLPLGKTWTFEQTALYLLVTEDTLRDWMQKRLIPYHQWGQTIRFVPEEVLAPQGETRIERMPAIQQSNEQPTPLMLFPDRMDMKQAEVYMGIKRRKIDYLKSHGELPYYKMGRRVVFDKKDLDAFLRGHRR